MFELKNANAETNHFILKLMAHMGSFITEFFAESVKVLQMLQARKELLESGIILLICPNRRKENDYGKSVL